MGKRGKEPELSRDFYTKREKTFVLEIHSWKTASDMAGGKILRASLGINEKQVYTCTKWLVLRKGAIGCIRGGDGKRVLENPIRGI